MKRKIEKMHELFGKADGFCGDCEHLVRYTPTDKSFYKCEVYGITSSEASDWVKKNRACGLFNRGYAGDVPIVKLIIPDIKDEQIEGQMSMFEGGE